MGGNKEDSEDTEYDLEFEYEYMYGEPEQRMDMRQLIHQYGVTAALVIANSVIFIIMEIMGDTEDAQFMMEHGAVYPPLLQENGEYWRLFTANFMHFGLIHLVNNMVMLAAAGQFLERALGHVRYLILYLAAGLGGSMLSYLQMLSDEGRYAVSAGASGAIFGIVGGLLWVVLRNKGHYETLTTQGILLMIALCIYYGVTSVDVDNWGHIGGLIGGFLFCVIFYRKEHQTY